MTEWKRGGGSQSPWEQLELPLLRMELHAFSDGTWYIDHDGDDGDILVQGKASDIGVAKEAAISAVEHRLLESLLQLHPDRDIYTTTRPKLGGGGGGIITMRGIEKLELHGDDK